MKKITVALVILTAMVVVGCGTTTTSQKGATGFSSYEPVKAGSAAATVHEPRIAKNQEAMQSRRAAEPSQETKREFTSTPRPVPAPAPVIIPAGYVPVDIPNPLLLDQECLLFWGSEPVNLVPDPRGGWMYSRPAMSEPFFILKGRSWFRAAQPFVVEAAHSEVNWWGYTTIAVPRNSNFVLVARARNFWGEGAPNVVNFTTGSDPFSFPYTQVTPSGGTRVMVGGLVSPLYSKPIMPVGPGPLRPTIDFDFRSLGKGIANGITNWIWGRRRP